MTVVEPSDNSKYAMSSPHYGKKKILCQVWHHDEQNIPHLIASKKVGFGEPDFTVQIGGKGFLSKKHKRRFMIVYDPKIGGLKQGKKGFIYDVNFEHANEPLSFHKFKEAKMVDSKQADTMLQDGAVDFFIAKGGIPMMYLLFAMIGMIVMGGGLAVIAEQYIPLSQQYDQLMKYAQSDDAKIASLQAQLKSGVGGTMCPNGAVCSH